MSDLYIHLHGILYNAFKNITCVKKKKKNTLKLIIMKGILKV
jgi:hypothetical protein